MNEKNEHGFLMEFLFEMNQIRKHDFIEKKKQNSSQNNCFRFNLNAENTSEEKTE